MWRPPDGSPPVGQEDVLRVLQTVRAGTCAELELASSRSGAETPGRSLTGTQALLALLQLGKELEAAGHLCDRHDAKRAHARRSGSEGGLD